MASKFERGHDDADGGSNNGLLLRDIKEISKALYLHHTPSKALLPPLDNRSKSTGKIGSSKPEINANPRFPRDDLLPKEKKPSSAWNWKKPLKALTHIGYQKFNCCFNLHVHSIDGLPSNFNGLSLSVLWKRKNIILQTRPSRIFQGVAEFDETLMHMCTVYGSQSGSNHPAKYESKLFLIYASLVGAPEIDIGKHQVDLTRLLPLSLEYLWSGKSSGKWTTSYRLTGKAKGASLNVSFSFQVIKDDLMKLSGGMNVLNPVNLEQGRLSTTRNLDDSSPGNMDLMLWQSGSVSHESCDGLVLPYHSNDVQICHGLLPNLNSGFSESISFLYQKLDQENFPDSTGEDSEHVEQQRSPTLAEIELTEETNGHESDGTDFTITEQGIETTEEDSLKLDQTTVQTVNVSAVEIIDVDEIIKDDDISLDKNSICNSKNSISVNCMDGVMVDDGKHKSHSLCFNPQSIEELSSAPKTSELLASNPLQPINEFLDQENYMGVKLNYKVHKMAKRSHSLDDITESLASDFLNMLGLESGSFDSSIDGDPQSPREQLLRQFEKEALTSGNFVINFDANTDELEFGHRPGFSSGGCSLDPNLSLIIQDAEEDHAGASQSLINRRRAKDLEDLETETLMQQWGLYERDFQNSPQTLSGGFGSPIELASEEVPVLPSIGPGLGSFIQTKDGGFLRSMSPSLLGNAKNGGSLIIQASSPVVLPAKIGNDVMKILLHMASSGVQELRDHINKLMPLLDITGKSIECILWNAKTSMAGPGREGLWEQQLFFGWDSNCTQKELEEFGNDRRYCKFKSNLTDEMMGLDCMSLEDVAPMTINKIESLLIEGLKIQSGMLNEEAPSYIHPKYTKSASGGKRVNPAGFSNLRAAELQIEDSGHIGNDIDGLLGLSITLDQWLRLDAGIIEEYQNSEQILNILKVHHPDITDLDSEGFKNLIDMAETSGGKHGFLGNHLTVAFVMQLRDSLRNYEPVGVPMLVLTQVERVYEHAMQQDHTMVFERKESETLPVQMESTDDADKGTSELRFKITGTHLAGVITKLGKKQLWGTATQQQSGFRWLLANGMGMTAKHSSSKSKAIVRSSSLLSKKLQNEDILWSISTNVHAMGTDGKDLTAENAHIRNPDIIFPN